jgi:virulence factor Mce-like protein
MGRRVIVAVLALAILGVPACSLPGQGQGSYTVTAYFPSAVALYSSAPVKVLGLPAGKVTKVEVEGDRIKVVMKIPNDVPVPDKVQAQIIPQSLIGERYVALKPAWTQGEARVKDGYVINLEDTVVPVEPDQALAALKKFLDSLDPKGLGQLITNLSDDLQGNGQSLNSAIDGISNLVATFADKDQQLSDIVDNFDQFTATLDTREAQLGQVLDAFAGATQVLADERQDLEGLLHSLAELSTNSLGLVADHADRLRTDIQTITTLAASIDANLGAVKNLLDSGPLLVTGLENAFNPALRASNLRTQFGPLAYQFIQPILGTLIPGFQLPCVLTTILNPCPPASTAAVAGQESAAAQPAEISSPHTPIDDVLALVGSPTAKPAPAPSTAERVAHGAGSLGSFLRGAAESMLGGGA